MFHSITEAIQDLKQGKMIIVVDDEDRENEGDLLGLGDYITSDMINFMITYGKGLVCAPITYKRSKELNLPLMITENTEQYKTAFTVSIDHITNTTGISAMERADTIKALTSAKTSGMDFKKPGHTFPLIANDGGVLERPGHTEAAVELATLCGASPVGVICEIINEDGSMARLPELMTFAEKHKLKLISIKDLLTYKKNI
ncbi:3,4-dihydroxy-2-butanone-4-phosphate synthase [Bacillus tamaricis]|uniref:3,4-dihydroxy-2-butanone 4-phosphate synthase n=1 Tax=Evansella tamaricis TaxID=2069301 RepID=A0ABS6JC23_9BACI|nr:3,4-dihydroxy-2-butanone-4-phosphate synthase [Evansella tamaricis]